MHIQDIFARDSMTLSFEFFPPKTREGAEQLYESVRQLTPLKPSFVDVTYGAGGSTRELTHELVLRIHHDTDIETIPHLTTVCHKETEIREMLEAYAGAGVGNILALSGDPPRDRQDWDRSRDAFRYAAELVEHITRFNQSGSHPDSRGFGIGVAAFPEGHPDTPNRLKEMDHLKAKVDAGAHYICTQMFFDNHDFYDFRERCGLAGIKIPILAGLMPVSSVNGMKRMADLAAGAHVPAALLRAIQRCGDDDAAVERVGIHWATQQCLDLLDNDVRGIHFYTLNRSDATRQIYQTLGLGHDSEEGP
jgi:methylenetetrahydrofolate reductase (NADPH)